MNNQVSSASEDQMLKNEKVIMCCHTTEGAEIWEHGKIVDS
jgi:hypothetical protein